MICRCMSLAFSLYTIVSAFPRQLSPRIISTPYGRLRGALVTLPHPRLPKVEVYHGLQYASVLGGQLRFMPPTGPMEKWDGIRPAIHFRPVCPQRLVEVEKLEQKLTAAEVEKWKSLNPFLEKQQEDCLYLNIYVPARAELLTKARRWAYLRDLAVYSSGFLNDRLKQIEKLDTKVRGEMDWTENRRRIYSSIDLEVVNQDIEADINGGPRYYGNGYNIERI